MGEFKLSWEVHSPSLLSEYSVLCPCYVVLIVGEDGNMDRTIMI